MESRSRMKTTQRKHNQHNNSKIHVKHTPLYSLVLTEVRNDHLEKK